MEVLFVLYAQPSSLLASFFSLTWINLFLFSTFCLIASYFTFLPFCVSYFNSVLCLIVRCLSSDPAHVPLIFFILFFSFMFFLSRLYFSSLIILCTWKPLLSFLCLAIGHSALIRKIRWLRQAWWNKYNIFLNTQHK